MNAITGTALDAQSVIIPLGDVEGVPDTAQQAPRRRTSVFFSASELHEQSVPARKWLVNGLIPSGTVTLLSGDGGTGKSLVALQLATSTALGRTWLGLSVTTGKALFVSAEDDKAELHRRIVDITQAEGVTVAELGGLTLRSLAGEDALLAVQVGYTGALKASALYNDIEQRLKADAPELVVLDTLADLFPGNENDRAQARQFIGLLRGLAIRHDCAVVVLSHPSLTGMNSGSGTSGSTGWSNSVRSRLYLERIKVDGYEANPDARMLRTMKANYGRTGGEITLTWNDGIFVADAPVTGLDRIAVSAKAERVFLKLLRQFTEEGRRVNHAAGLSYAPKAFSEHSEREGVTKPAFKAAMDRLLQTGKIKIHEHGPQSRRRSFLALVEDS